MKWFLTLTLTVFLSSISQAHTEISTYQSPGGPELKFVLSTPTHPFSEKKAYPVWIFQSDDGKLLNTFNTTTNLLRAELVSKAEDVVFVWPELQREHFAKDASHYCSLDFLHREKDLNALIDRIKGYDFVDPTRIYLIGHQAGSAIVTLVGNQRNDLAGVATISGNFSAPFANATGECAKASGERQLPKDYPWACQALSNQCSQESQLTVRSGTFWQQYFEMDMIQEIGKSRVPYLALVGDQDEKALSDLIEHRTQIGQLNPKFQYQVVPGMEEDLGLGLKVWSAIKTWSQSHK